MALVHPMMDFMNLKENGWEGDTLFWHLRGTLVLQIIKI